MIIKWTDKNGVVWYLYKAIAKNKKTVYFMKKENDGNAASVNGRWLREYEIIQGTNCPIIKKRR